MCVWGGGGVGCSDISIYTKAWPILGFKICNFDIFKDFQKKKFFGGMEFLVGILRGVTSKLGYLKGSFLKVEEGLGLVS